MNIWNFSEWNPTLSHSLPIAFYLALSRRTTEQLKSVLKKKKLLGQLQAAIAWKIGIEIAVSPSLILDKDAIST